MYIYIYIYTVISICIYIYIYTVYVYTPLDAGGSRKSFVQHLSLGISVLSVETMRSFKAPPWCPKGSLSQKAGSDLQMEGY